MWPLREQEFVNSRGLKHPRATEWHPWFDLEAVPDPPEADLPKPAARDVVTAQQALDMYTPNASESVRNALAAAARQQSAKATVALAADPARSPASKRARRSALAGALSDFQASSPASRQASSASPTGSRLLDSIKSPALRAKVQRLMAQKARDNNEVVVAAKTRDDWATALPDVVDRIHRWVWHAGVVLTVLERTHPGFRLTPVLRLRACCSTYRSGASLALDTLITKLVANWSQQHANITPGAHAAGGVASTVDPAHRRWRC